MEVIHASTIDELEDKEQEVYFNFINSLKTRATKDTYESNIKLYLKFCNLNKLSQLLTIQDPQKQIIIYIMSLKKRGLSTNSIHTMLYGIYHFYTMNDIILNKKKINSFLGEPTPKPIDRPYTTEEIQKILNVSDLRMKVAIGLMYSAGLRIGAIAQLKLRNLEKIESCYKVVVYEGSNESYYSFVTPEVANFIDNYLAYRTKSGEQLHKDSYLIRDQFDITDQEQIRDKSRSIQTCSLENMLSLLLVKSGLRHINPTYKRHEIPRAHGFRKFFTKQLIDSKLDLIHVELLLGHDIGLPGKYYRPTEQDMFRQFEKAINNLTINEENRLRKKVKTLEIEKTRLDELESSLKRLERKYNAEQ